MLLLLDAADARAAASVGAEGVIFSPEGSMLVAA
jgi:hypothetical protein